MDNQKYLDQITASAKPVKSRSNAIIPPLALKLIIAGVALAVLMIIFGIIVGNMGTKVEDLSKKLSIRIDLLSQSIGEYNPSVKSSLLRSKGTATKTILDDTQHNLTEYLQKTYNYKKADEKSKIFKDEKSSNDKLANELKKAKLNAYLDHIYEYKLSSEIESVISLEKDIAKRSDKDNLKKIVNDSMSSLSEIKNSIDRLSEPNKQ